MKVFYSWQSDLPNSANRSFIRNALTEAVKRIAADLDVDDADRPEVDEATKGAKGMVDITASILRKISECAIYVADVTPVANTRRRKALPNPNVMYEMGWASHKPGYDYIIGVMNIHKNKGPECLPFDLRGRRILTYALAQDATPDERKAVAKSLTHDLTAALRDNIAGALDKKADQSTISRFPSDPNDFTIWMGPNKQLSIPNSFGRLETLAIEPGPRAYARIVPASWPHGPPDPLVIEKSQPAVQPQSGSYGSGSFGTCELGFARYWYSHVADDTHRSTNTIALYLEEFGEYWFADATCIGEAKAGLVLSIPRLLCTWYSCSLQALQSLDALGASKRRYIEIGVNGIKNVYLAHRGEFYQTPQSRKASIRHDMPAASWTPETLAQLVHKAHNDVLSAFSLERIALDAFMKKLEEL